MIVLRSRIAAMPNFADALMPAARNRLKLHDRFRWSGATIISLAVQ